MTPDHFSRLLETYGADFAHWPEAERAPARALLQQNPPALRAALAQEMRLEHWLSADARATPDEALAERIIARALADGVGKPAGKPAKPAHSWWRAPWLWPGAGFAGIGLAGTLAGALLVSFILQMTAPAASPEWPERGTSFASLPAYGGEE